MMAKSSAPKPVEALTYEQAVAELEGIVSSLEGEQNPLDEAMKLYERGQALVTRCSSLLEAAELKVKQLSGENLVAFEDES
jgi:exodeoxyribonuclease VII small subunit